MTILQSLFSKRAILRGLIVSAVIAVVYLIICLALVFWPSPPPFENTPSPAACESTSPDSQMDFGELTIPARDGTRLFARRIQADASTTIVFMHGIAPTGSAMETGALRLHAATGADVIIPDFRGHGRSGGNPRDVSYIGQYEDDLEDIIRFIHRDKPADRIIIAGYSMGGGVAMRYVLKDDATVPDAYLLFAPNFGEGPTQKSQDGIEGEDKEASAYIHFDARRFLGIALFNSVGIRAFDLLPILYFNTPSGIMEYSYRAVLSAQPIQPNTADLALQAVTSPLLVVIGSEDEVFEADQFEPFVSENSQGETVILPGLNHEGIITDPSTFEIVEAWYRNLP
jgi:alpha-beta hydrolase superfamily lysophospholipase